MKTILIGSILLGCVLFVFRFIYEHYLSRRVWTLASQKYKLIEPLMNKLATQQPVSAEAIRMLAMKPSLRCGLFRVLEATNRKVLFPPEYYSLEKGAEAYLANWLEYPTELGAAPVEVAFDTKVTLYEEQPLDYFVFKYKPAARRVPNQSDWLLGVAGPYHTTSLPYDTPRRIFSRFNLLGSITAREEAEWVHKNISPDSKAHAVS